MLPLVLLSCAWSALVLDERRPVRVEAAQVEVQEARTASFLAASLRAALPDSGFHPVGSLSLGAYGAPYLVRIPLRSPRPGRWWLSSELRTPERMRLGSTAGDLGEHGTGIPFGQRRAGTLGIAVPLDLSEVDTLWILASDPNGDCKLDMELVPDAAFPAYVQWNTLRTGFFLGCLGAISIAAFYLCAVVRQKAFAWYAALGLLGWCWIATKSGLPSALVWPDSPWWNRVAPGLLSWSSIGAFGFFVVHLLDLRRHSRALARALSTLSGIQIGLGVAMPLSVFAPRLHARLFGTVDLEWLQVLLLCLLSVAVIQRLRAGDRLALRLAGSIAPLVAALLVGTITDLRNLGFDRDFDRDLVGAAALLQGALTTVVLLGEVQARQRSASRLERDFHARLVDRTEAHERAIAYELHDDLGQRAAALQLQARGLFAEQGLSGPQRELGRRIGELVERIRILSHRLQPPSAPDSDLPKILADVCMDMEDASGVDILFRSKGKAVPSREVSRHVRRIAQESISNALRHGNPATIDVQLDLDARSLRLEVLDDGAGFDPESTRKGLGMISMRERANAIGGSLEIRSRPGSTLVRLLVPSPSARA